MFETLTERARRSAERRAKARADALARGLEERLPPGVSCLRSAEGVALVGRGLKRRFALDARLRALFGRNA